MSEICSDGNSKMAHTIHCIVNIIDIILNKIMIVFFSCCVINEF